jgi:hypothetical protein
MHFGIAFVNLDDVEANVVAKHTLESQTADRLIVGNTCASQYNDVSTC